MKDPTPASSELIALLEIQFDGRTSTRVSGSIAADGRHHQPWGIVHGGLYTTAIETFATLVARGQVRLQNVGAPPRTDGA
jgi:acyl-coenzyme A thioesterase PaaI-like protein